MSDTMLLFVGISVFSLMLIGVVLTILEFRFGKPRQQEEARKEQASDSAEQGTQYTQDL
jgi:hypothetical protein